MGVMVVLLVGTVAVVEPAAAEDVYVTEDAAAPRLLPHCWSTLPHPILCTVESLLWYLAWCIDRAEACLGGLLPRV